MDARTSNSSGALAAAELRAVLDEIGVAAGPAPADTGADLVVGESILVEVKTASRPSLTQLNRWHAQRRPGGPEEVMMVLVADRIEFDLREALDRASWGWLDRTGHLRLVVGGFHIDREIEPLLGPEVNAKNPLNRESGLAVAVELLSSVDSPGLEQRSRPTVRDVARAAGVSVGSAHRAMRELTDLGLLNGDGSPRSSLFWSVSREWDLRWHAISRHPAPQVPDAVQRLLRFQLDDLASIGWALAGDAAAVAYGAPIVTEEQPRFLLPDRRALVWALRTFGEPTDDRSAAAFVAVPPTEAAVRSRRPGRSWPLARRIVVALELASSGPRSREVLEQWSDRPSIAFDD